MSSRLGFAAIVLLALVGATSEARAEDGLNDLIKVFADEQQTPAEREQALTKATNLSRALASKPERIAPFKEALRPLLASLSGKRSDASFEKLILAGFSGLDVFPPFPELGGVVKPYLHAEAARDIRVAALRAIELHGATGVGRELVSLLHEKAKKERLRELLERSVVSCTILVPTDEAEKVLVTALQSSQFKNVKRAACAALGDLNQLRAARELHPKETRAALVAASSAENPEPEVAAAAALALVRFNSFEGIAEAMKRLEAPKGDTRLAYKTICEAAHQADGFLNLPPERYYEANESRRKDVLAEVKLWWSKFKTRDPDAAFFEALKAAGVAVPRDTAAGSKEAISALIEGLEVESRTLRYGALDLLVRRTGRTDLGADFKVLKTQFGGGQMNLSEWEPAEGFQDKERKEKLRAQQKAQADIWRKWWQSVSARAVLVDGVWSTK